MVNNQIIVVDIEATCWKHNRTPPGQESEIIEIGVCLLDLGDLTIHDKRSVLVRPKNSTVSRFCTELTTLTQEMVEQGISFPQACDVLVTDYDSKQRPWLSWGDYDRTMFEKQCTQRNIPYPFTNTHINFKRIFGNIHGKSMGMARALRHSGIGLEGTHHRGVDDAYNTARLVVHSIREHKIDLFELSNAESTT